MKAQSDLYRYAYSCRNLAKRAYALAYIGWILTGRKGDAPEPDGLSAMAAQAVRMNVESMPGVKP